MAAAETTAIGRNVVKAERTRAVSQRPRVLRTKEVQRSSISSRNCTKKDMR